MNIFLWILQTVFALHTAIGAVWKISHSAEETMPSLSAIPDGVWMGMAGLEILCSILLVLPAVYKPAVKLIPLAAGFIVAEMLVFCGLHLSSGDANIGPMVYWLVVAALCAFIIYGRLKLRPL